MNIVIEPNYEIFVQIMFTIFLLMTISNIMCGILHVDINKRKNYGGIEIVKGFIMFIIICIVIL